jgi:hypothetical protein
VPINKLTGGKARAGGGIVPGNAFALRIHKVPVSSLTTGEKDTGFDFPTGAVILGVWVQIATAESTATTKTIDVGLLSSESGGDTDGLIDGLATSASGVKQPSIIAGAVTLGVLMHVDLNGAVNTFEPHVVTTAKSLVYQLGSAHTELDADIVVMYLDPNP